ncbi:hypothetical protein C8R44DRAFT_752550 [Mycena epipterygia]|nr:hypothetical protein C8R44DRAFT_752550 [Mycena epipterygia]
MVLMDADRTIRKKDVNDRTRAIASESAKSTRADVEQARIGRCALSFLLHLAALRCAPSPSHLTPSPSPLCIRTRQCPPTPPLHANTPRAASCAPPPNQAHIGIGLGPTRRAPPPGPTRARGGGALACRRRRCDIGCELVLRGRTRWGRGACGTDTEGTDSSSADADPEAPLPTLEAALAMDLSLTPAESRSYLVRIHRDPAADVQGAHAACAAPARPYGPAATTTNTRTLVYAARMRWRRPKFIDLCPARTQPAPGLGGLGPPTSPRVREQWYRQRRSMLANDNYASIARLWGIPHGTRRRS